MYLCNMYILSVVDYQNKYIFGDRQEKNQEKSDNSQNVLAHWSATVMTPLIKIQRAYIALYHTLLYLR